MTIRIAFPGLLVLLAACHSEGPTSSGMDTVDASSMHTDGAGSDVASSSPNPSSSVKPVGQAVLRGDGSLAIFRPKKNPFAFATVDTDAAAPVEGQWLQVSAPILPKVLRLYQGEGNNYPNTFAARSTLAKESALTFEELEQACLDFSPEYTSAIALSPYCRFARLTLKSWDSTC